MAKVQWFGSLIRSVSSGVTYYGSFGAGVPGLYDSTDRTAIFRTAGVLSGLQCRYHTNPHSTATTLTLWKNGGAGNQVISIAAGATGEFIDSVNTDTHTAGQTLGFKVVGGTTGTGALSAISVLFGATTNTVTRLVSYASDTWVVASTTHYHAFGGSAAGLNPTEANASRYSQYDGTLRNLNAYVATNGSANATTLRSRVNGANGAMSISIAAGVTGNVEDNTNSDSLTSDTYNWSAVTGSGTVSFRFTVVAVEYETTTGHFFLVAYKFNGIVPTTSTTTYLGFGDLISTYTDANSQQRANVGFRASHLNCQISANTISATSTLRLRKNGANANQIVSITASTTGGFEDGSNIDDIVVNDELNCSLVTGGTGTSLTMQRLGMLGIAIATLVVADSAFALAAEAPSLVPVGVAATHLLTASSDTGASSYVTASISPSANKLILVAITSAYSPSPINFPTLSGCGLTWEVAGQHRGAAGTQQVTVFRGLGSPTPGALTFDFAGQAQVRAAWFVTEFDGVDLSGANGSGAITQAIDGGWSSGSAHTSFSLTLPATVVTGNATYGAARFFNVPIVPGAGYTELGEVTAQGGAATSQAEWRIDGQAVVDWTYESHTGGVQAVAIEIRSVLNPTLVPADLAVALAVENVALVQQNTLAVQDSALATTVENVTLVQQYALAVEDSALALSIEAPSLTQQNALPLDDSTTALAIESLTLAVVPSVVVVPPDSGFIGGSGGGGFSRGGSVTSGTTVSRQRWKAWERAITQSMRAPDEKRGSAKAAKKQPTKATVEAAIRRLNLPEPQKERILQEWKSKLALPSLEVVAIAYGLSTRADVAVMLLDTGNEAQMQPIVTFTDYGRMGIDAIKNPSDEELIQLLLTS